MCAILIGEMETPLDVLSRAATLIHDQLHGKLSSGIKTVKMLLLFCPTAGLVFFFSRSEECFVLLHNLVRQKSGFHFHLLQVAAA